jgi:hypothetical protein
MEDNLAGQMAMQRRWEKRRNMGRQEDGREK